MHIARVYMCVTMYTARRYVCVGAHTACVREEKGLYSVRVWRGAFMLCVCVWSYIFRVCVQLHILEYISLHKKLFPSTWRLPENLGDKKIEKQTGLLTLTHSCKS